ncbi:MAG: hypothetical protein KJ915_10960 [Candidatus Omnitrophica bacterium]|nr:hypothetical protein [Candidatus Omnitrophota bacterium]
MKQKLFLLGLAAILVISGCSKKADDSMAKEPETKMPAMEQKLVAAKQVMAETGKQAIAFAEKLKTVAEKKEYLIAQAEAFYASKKFEQVSEVGQYVLQYLDKDSAAAKDLLEKAKAQVQAQAQKAVGDVKQALGGLNN